jgi:hypothetical protein
VVAIDITVRLRRNRALGPDCSGAALRDRRAISA